jgi:hypothetical protein
MSSGCHQLHTCGKVGVRERQRERLMRQVVLGDEPLLCMAGALQPQGEKEGSEKRKANRGPRLNPGGRPPRHSARGGRRGGQRRATRDEGGSERGHKKQCTRPAVNTRRGLLVYRRSWRRQGHSRCKNCCKKGIVWPHMISSNAC